jgi:hypothetical protein
MIFIDSSHNRLNYILVLLAQYKLLMAFLCETFIVLRNLGYELGLVLRDLKVRIVDLHSLPLHLLSRF